MQQNIRVTLQYLVRNQIHTCYYNHEEKIPDMFRTKKKHTPHLLILHWLDVLINFYRAPCGR
jgi:hypothetical protein